MNYRFLRNPVELKNIKNISLLRQQMEAQATAQKMAAQQAAAQAAASGDPGAVGNNNVESGCMGSPEEPTDLTMASDEKEALRVRRERQRYLDEATNRSPRSAMAALAAAAAAEEGDNNARDREDLKPASFNYRRLIPSAVSVKSENY